MRFTEMTEQEKKLLHRKEIFYRLSSQDIKNIFKMIEASR